MDLADIDLCDPGSFVSGVPYDWFAQLRERGAGVLAPGPGGLCRRVLGRHPLRRLRGGQPGLRALLLVPPDLALPRLRRGAARAAADDDGQHGPAAAHPVPAPGQQGLHPADDPRPRGQGGGLHRRHPRLGVRAGVRRLRRADLGRATAPGHRRPGRRPPGGPAPRVRLVEPHDRGRRSRVPGERRGRRPGRHGALRLRRPAVRAEAPRPPRRPAQRPDPGGAGR